MTTWSEDALARLVWTAQERERIRLRRAAGALSPWTDDPILAGGRYCNVWREHDKTSVVILDILRMHKPWVRPALACGLRLINRWATLVRFRPGLALPDEMRRLVGLGINTNAYRINTPLGLNNKAGVCQLMDRAGSNMDALYHMSLDETSFASLHRRFVLVSGLGSFIAYQALLDLRDLGMLDHVADDWAYPGPGAARGLARLEGTWTEAHWSDKSNRLANYGSRAYVASLEERLGLLTPVLREMTGWARWSIHETEGWLCEWDKYERLRARAAVAGNA